MEIDLVCVDCGGRMLRAQFRFRCEKCGRIYKVREGIIDCLGDVTDEVEFSKDKWDEWYRTRLGSKEQLATFEGERDFYQKYGVDQIKRHALVSRKTVYLEIGCGPFYIGTLLAGDCAMVVGIDFSLEALKVAKKMLEVRKIKNYLLIRGDIFHMPLKNGSVNLIYGGGVIEHFKDTMGSIREFGRVLARSGVAINAVPMLNVGALTYRQIWGNIPDFPLLKQLAELIHIKILKGKHMYFGYEMSFGRGKMIKMHRLAGFREVIIKRLETEVMMGFAPKWLKPLFIWLAKNCSWFWPMMVVVAKK